MFPKAQQLLAEQFADAWNAALGLNRPPAVGDLADPAKRWTVIRAIDWEQVPAVKEAKALSSVLWIPRVADARRLGLWSTETERAVTLSKRAVEGLGFYDYDTDAWEQFVVAETARRRELGEPVEPEPPADDTRP